MPYLISIACLLSFPLDSSADDTYRGPLRIRDQYPLALMHHSAEPRSALTAEKGSLKFDTTVDWANSFTKRRNYRIDAETRVVTSELYYGIFSGTEAWLSLPVIWRGGGILDGFIDGWHDFFSQPQGGRDQIDRDEFTIFGKLDDGRTFSISDSGTRLGDPALGIKHMLNPNAESAPVLALAGVVRVPVQNGSFGQTGFDTEVSLLAAKKYSPFFSYFGVSYLHSTDAITKNIEFYRHRVSGFAAVEWKFSEVLSFNLGLQAASAVIRNVPTFPKYTLYLDMGGRIRLGGSRYLELGVRENPAPRVGSADVSLHLGFSSTLW